MTVFFPLSPHAAKDPFYSLERDASPNRLAGSIEFETEDSLTRREAAWIVFRPPKPTGVFLFS